MELSQLANIGEFLGGVAVIVSLVYLAVQIRQNTLSVRATTFQATTELITDSTARIASDPELARIYAGGLSGAGDLSEIDRFRFGLLMVTVVRRLESAYFQREVGVLSEEQWSGIATVIPGLLTSEGGRPGGRAAAASSRGASRPTSTRCSRIRVQREPSSLKSEFCRHDQAKSASQPVPASRPSTALRSSSASPA